MFEQSRKPIIVALRYFGRVLGMQTYASQTPGTYCSAIRMAASRSGGPSPGTDRKHTSYTRINGALDNFIAIIAEAAVVQVHMRIDELHFKRAPGSMSSWNPVNTGGPSGREAATIIPRDSIPRSFLGPDSPRSQPYARRVAPVYRPLRCRQQSCAARFLRYRL